MATKSIDAAQAAVTIDARAEAATLLSRYPELSDKELKMLDTWFRRTAGPLDLGLLASEPGIAEQYRSYRAARYDRFSGRDLAIAAVFVGIAACILGMLVMLAP